MPRYKKEYSVWYYLEEHDEWKKMFVDFRTESNAKEVRDECLTRRGVGGAFVSLTETVQLCMLSNRKEITLTTYTVLL